MISGEEKSSEYLEVSTSSEKKKKVMKTESLSDTLALSQTDDSETMKQQYSF